MNERENVEFKKRAYGFVIIKSINSNYNADFTGQPRTLPSGKIYATDKALKYTVRHFIKNEYPQERVFFYKRLNKNLNPFTLAEAYNNFFNSSVEHDDKKTIIKNLLSAIDVRFFGATFAPKGNNISDKNVSIHGPVQVNHGINIWNEDNIYTEQIMSPFRNESDNEKEKSQSTLGRQSKLEEGHYVHHFSINPKNLQDLINEIEEPDNLKALSLTERDIDILKEALRKGATYYDSAAKSGTENEVLFYLELKEGSKLVLPNFTEMIKIRTQDDKKVFDLETIKNTLEDYKDDVEKIEIYYNKNIVNLENIPEAAKTYSL